MTIAEYASGIELVFNPPDILAIYLMAKAFNVDVHVLKMWNGYSYLQDMRKKMMDIRISVIYNGGFKFTSTHKFKYI